MVRLTMMIIKTIRSWIHWDLKSIPIASNENCHQHWYRYRFDICINCTTSSNNKMNGFSSLFRFEMGRKELNFLSKIVDSLMMSIYIRHSPRIRTSKREQQTKKKIQIVKRTPYKCLPIISMEKILIFHLQIIRLIYTPNEKLQWEFVKLVNGIQNG